MHAEPAQLQDSAWCRDPQRVHLLRQQPNARSKDCLALPWDNKKRDRDNGKKMMGLFVSRSWPSVIYRPGGGRVSHAIGVMVCRPTIYDTLKPPFLKLCIDLEDDHSNGWWIDSPYVLRLAKGGKNGYPVCSRTGSSSILYVPVGRSSLYESISGY